MDKPYIRKSKKFSNSLLKDLKKYESPDLTIQNNPELMAHFCPGAPIIINENIAPLRGIANGTRGVLYSIDWETNDLRERALEFINQ